MDIVYSKAIDCTNLAIKLKKKLGDRIGFSGSIHLEIISGEYTSLYRLKKEKYNLNKTSIPFYFKFCENKFLRIGVYDNSTIKTSLGEKLAALSDFYLVLSDLYGMPTVFFTTKDDLENTFSLEWNFINTKECIEAFKNGTYIDDAEIKDLIVFEKNNDKLSEIRSKEMGLPVELLPIVDNVLDDYFMHKFGEELGKKDSESNEKKLVKKN